MTPVVIESTNLSKAWMDTLKLASHTAGGELLPFVLSLAGFEEDINIRQMVDKHLQANNKYSIKTVSETIFPQSLYEDVKYDRHKLYTKYIQNLPRLMAIVQDNKRGTYFQRLIDFDATDKTEGNQKKSSVNQLEIIIEALKNKTINRRTQYQACIFDPKQDHVKGPYQRFPCLGHITFYKSEIEGLVLNSFYPVQHLYTKAYGNWLGLINLGKFVAKEAELEFGKLICFAGVQTLGEQKKDVRNLL